ncbi:MAG TPA: TonB-dependent receptor plug domain-containing protein [Balneolaceae bacterium]|nr:TonB-dependent receptor plug domain-containing protein [Balneolaceae bacterium]
MKSLHFFLLLLSLLFTYACSASQHASQPQENNAALPEGSVQDDKDIYRSLADYLQQVPGVNVMGSQGNQIVTIRGINSFNSGIEPLFVINGQIIGSSYSQANSMVNVRDIDYVRVLKGPDAATYGVRGGNGVVLIVTK